VSIQHHDLGPDSAPPDAVVVVGGGVVGLATAVELARRGRTTVIVDRGEIAAGCGIGSAGHIVPSHVIPLAAPGMVRRLRRELGRRNRALSIAWTLSPSFWSWAVSFMRHCTVESVDSAVPALDALGGLSAELVRELGAGADIQHLRDGLLDVYGSSKAFEHACDHADELRGHGVRVQTLDAAELRRLEPAANDSIVGAIQFPDDSSVHPASLLHALHEQAKGAGVTFVPRTEVTGFRCDGDRVSAVSTTRGDVQARHVVVAAGAWSGTFADALGERLPVVGARGLSLTTERPSTGPRRTMLLGEQHVAVAPSRDELRLSGWFELGQWSTTASPHRIDRIESLARSRLDFDATLSNRRTWAGLRPMTPDAVPIIGPSTRWHNVTIATGHGMTGLSMGLGTGRLVAQSVVGEPTDIDIGRFSTGRFA